MKKRFFKASFVVLSTMLVGTVGWKSYMSSNDSVMDSLMLANVEALSLQGESATEVIAVECVANLSNSKLAISKGQKCPDNTFVGTTAVETGHKYLCNGPSGYYIPGTAKSKCYKLKQ